MADNVVNLDSKNRPITVQDVENVIATVKKLLALGKGLSLLTKSDLDDKIVDYMTKVVVVVEPFATDDVAVSLVNFVVGLFNKDSDVVAAVKEKVKALVA